MFLIKKNLLPFIAQYLCPDPVIVEAGAFTGSDTINLTHFWPEAHIHSFEPVPEIFYLLQKNTAPYKHVHTYNYALSNKKGITSFYISESPKSPGKPFQAGSLHKPQDRLYHSPIQYPYTISIATTTLDRWTREHKLDRVDFLWLDAQGHELAILQGATHILSSVSVLYTEVHFGAMYENQPTFQEISKWLFDYNFTLVGTDFRNETDWFFGNALFIKKT